MAQEAPSLAGAIEEEFDQCRTDKFEMINVEYTYREAKKRPDSILSDIPMNTQVFDEIKKTFLELKPKYIANNTKSNFFDQIAKKNPAADYQYAAQEYDKALAQAQDKKRSLRQKKEETRAVENAIRENIKLLKDGVRQAKENQVAREELEKKIEQVQRQWKALQQKNHARRIEIETRANLSLPDAEQCKQVLQRQTQSIQELQEKKTLLEDKLTGEAPAEYKQVQANLDKLKQQIDEKEHDDNNLQIVRDLGRVENMMKWYKAMNVILEKIAGVKILSHTTRSLSLRINETYDLTFDLEPKTLKLSNPKISPEKIDLDELIEDSLRATYNPAEFLRETACLLEAHEALESDLRKLNASTSFSIDMKGENHVFARLPSGFEVLIACGRLYPKQKFQLVQITHATESIGTMEISQFITSVEESTRLQPLKDYLHRLEREISSKLH